MKKRLLVILAAVIFLFLPIVKVNAAPPVITETSYADGRITISGTGDGEIQIVLFDLDNSPLYMTTVTADGGVFSITLPPIAGLKEDTYNIRVSDYGGTETSTGTVKVTPEANPLTDGSIKNYIILAIISFVGLVGAILYGRKRKPFSR